MKTQPSFTLKEVLLKNNCPECYSNDGLTLTFKQRFTENLFYKAITEETALEMHCKVVRVFNQDGKRLTLTT